MKPRWSPSGRWPEPSSSGWSPGGGRALRAGEEHGSTNPGPLALFTAVLAFKVLGLSGLIHVDGVLAVFVCGLALNGVSTGSKRTSEVSIDEAVNRFLVLPLFIGVGAAPPWAAWADLGWRGVLLAVVVFLLRRLPVVVALRRRLRLGWPDALYPGVVRPDRCLGAVLPRAGSQAAGADATVLAAGSLVVVASVVVHGMTAAPGRAAYRAATRHGSDPDIAAIPGRSGRPG